MCRFSEPPNRLDRDTIFQRVRSAYDLDRLKLSRVIYVGTGGAASFIEDMARAGVGEHILIDPDTVVATNLATQHTYTGNIGKPKVECLAKRLSKINPFALVHTYQQPLDEIDDDEFSLLVNYPLIVPLHNAGSPP